MTTYLSSSPVATYYMTQYNNLSKFLSCYYLLYDISRELGKRMRGGPELKL